MKITLFILTLLWVCSLSDYTRTQASSRVDPKAIMQESQDKLQGKSAFATLTMSIVRPSWQRDLTMKSWSKGQDYSLILVTAPARDKGVAFLKREKEMWNWQPSIDRVIKLPPSMMSQSWMGSDFTNDDLVEHSSLTDDFEHSYLGKEMIDGMSCHQIELKAKEEAAVVWDRLLVWVDEEELMQLKLEFYDEDGYLVNTMYGKDPLNFDGKLLPSILEVVPDDEPGNKTIIKYESLEFDVALNNRFFSVQNLKKVR